MFSVIEKRTREGKAEQDVSEYVLKIRSLCLDLFQIKFFSSMISKLYTMVYLNLAGLFIPDFLSLNHSHDQTKFS